MLYHSKLESLHWFNIQQKLGSQRVCFQPYEHMWRSLTITSTVAQQSSGIIISAKKFYDKCLRAFLKQSYRNDGTQLLQKKIQAAYSLNLFKGRIFSHERPFYERAVSNLDTQISMHRPVQVTHNSFIEGLHAT